MKWFDVLIVAVCWLLAGMDSARAVLLQGEPDGTRFVVRALLEFALGAAILWLSAHNRKGGAA